MKNVSKDAKQATVLETGLQKGEIHFDFIHAGPTCGKSTVAAQIIRNGGSVIDTDVVLFDWFIAPVYDQLHAMNPRPWHSHNPLWGSICQSALAMTQVIADLSGSTIVTNLHVHNVQATRGGISVFRSAQDLAEVFIERQKTDSKKDPLTDEQVVRMTEGWFDGWRKSNNFLGVKVELERGEYLSDLLHITVDDDLIKDVALCRKICRDHALMLVKHHKLDHLVPFAPFK